MTDNLDNGVKAETTPAPVVVEVVKETSPVATPDYEKEFNALLEENAKIAQDRDNYKKGLLQAKGKLPVELAMEEPDLDSLIVKKVPDTLLRT